MSPSDQDSKKLGAEPVKPLWCGPVSLEQINKYNHNTIHVPLGIVFSAIGDDFLEATMPVDERTKQARGILHGGASALLGESLGSCASTLVVGPGFACVGVDLHATHMSAMTQGGVIGRATPLKIGRTMHFWRVVIRDASRPKRTVCEVKLTVMVRPA